MIKRIITCDRCGENISEDDNHLILYGWWTKQEGYLEDMPFHPSCWDEAMRLIKKENEEN